ncbi:MAG: hypothetical protein BroJett040_19420 [Oligoflexia bacterium]|nr:MAG: hypothetical protein BroJett040_19420 [Oligoflexia bacterium]
MRFIAIIFTTLLLTTMTITTVHMWGLSQVFTPFESPFYPKDKPWAVVPWDQYEEVKHQFPDAILWADVYQSASQTILVSPWKDHDLASKLQTQAPSQDRPTLSELVQKYPTQKFILNVTSNLLDVDRQIAEIIKSEERFLIQSDYDVIMKSMKELRPRNLYGSSIADRMRFVTFQSLWILPATPLKGDVFIGSLKHKKVDMFNSDIAKELQRRHKKIILGPLKTEAEFTEAIQYQPDGFFTDQIPLLHQFLRK